MSKPAHRILLALMVPLGFGCTDVSDLDFGLFEGQQGPECEPMEGALFTTTDDGTVVNENVHYETKCDVYLNGGPGHPGAAGLDPGTYYYQVTDPSGMVLLSSDSIEHRMVTVDGSGRFVSAFDHHTMPNLVDQGIVVQLCPYATSPNNGDEYKVWITRTEDYGSTSPGARHGFAPNCSKTDNFKVRLEAPPPDGGVTPPPDGGMPPGEDDGSDFDQ